MGLVLVVLDACVLSVISIRRVCGSASSVRRVYVFSASSIRRVCVFSASSIRQVCV